MAQILYLEKRGCNFFHADTEERLSDIGNYRVCTHGESIKGKDGNMYFLEFALWSNRKKARFTHKVTGKPLKHVKYDIINPCAVAIDTQYTNAAGCWRNCNLETDLYTKNYSYTQADILLIVNEISVHKYDRIIFAPAAALEAVPAIMKIAGCREMAILKALQEITLEQADKTYTVYRFHGSDGDYFDYEMKSGRITG